jgi:hypothetical protein
MALTVVNDCREAGNPRAAAHDLRMQSNISSVQKLPDWLPDGVRLYLIHTENGISYRALARSEGRHASTVMRTVRRYETRRDDPLLDEALTALASPLSPKFFTPHKDDVPMSADFPSSAIVADQETINTEGKRILRRLVETGAVLAFAPDMEKAVVLREFPDGRSLRTAVVDRTIAQAFALKDWIFCKKAGRVATYEISARGKAALISLLEQTGEDPGFAEAQARFEGPGDSDSGLRRMRYNLAETPVSVLGRRRDKDGNLFLPPELVTAAERLREDFELAQMGPRVAQNWERFLTGGDRGSFRSDSGLPEGPRAARERVAAALRDLGPGLGDVALRVCCFLEGIETTEQRLGWAARSGKVVLRIALQRLHRHFEATYGRSGPLIG